ncbi:MAG: hypothetical protein IPP88_21790 [Betaproteobacteria bacterium]|nr:hypothetical protein [Betaproteobacteria bacterium]
MRDCPRHCQGIAALGGIATSNSILHVGLDKEGVYKTIDGGVNWTLWGKPAY